MTVLVPTAEGEAALAGVDGVRALHYDRSWEFPPPGGRDAEVLVPGFLFEGDSHALIARLPRLRLVQLLSAGAEQWVGKLPDGVLLSICRGAHGGSTAEWTLAMLLSIYRELPGFERSRLAMQWDQHWTDTLQGKRILIVGAGDLARQLVRRLEGFDAEATVVGSTARDGVHGVDELPSLLPDHDATVLMVPLTAHTTGMVDARFLAAMPDGAILVNAARGPVVDTDALLAELASGRLRAALDVTDPEPLPEDHPLWSVEGLSLTPHVGGSCTGSQQRAWAVAAAEIARFAAGDMPENLVGGEY
ncbi:MAG: 2-hydroxyacid dehydrogenase [Sciscionella sp.]